MTLYRYGWMAWVWRLLILLGVAMGLIFAWAGTRDEPIQWFMVVFGLGFAAFPLLLGQMVATRVEGLPDGRLRVWTLNLTWRTLGRERLGGARYRVGLEGRGGQMFAAPRLWVGVRGGPPIYLDLLAAIPDPEAFRAVFPYDDGSARRGRPRRKGRRAPDNSWDPPTL